MLRCRLSSLGNSKNPSALSSPEGSIFYRDGSNLQGFTKFTAKHAEQKDLFKLKMESTGTRANKNVAANEQRRVQWKDVEDSQGHQELPSLAKPEAKADQKTVRGHVVFQGLQ